MHSRFLFSLLIASIFAVSCKGSGEKYTFEMTPEISEYLDNWLGDNPYPEMCRPSSYYVEKMNQFAAEPAQEGCVIMLGDSITDFADWNSLFPGCNILNRGIAGDLVEGISLRLDEVARHNPSQVFFLAGCNNFVKRLTNRPEDVCAALEAFFKKFREKMPETVLHVQSLLPMNQTSVDYTDHYNSDVLKVNGFLKEKQSEYSYDYIDISTPFTDGNGQLAADMTQDGCHPTQEAYAVWSEIIKDKIVK